MKNSCKICSNIKNNKLHEAREMMFGLKEKFIYAECANCGCLQLLDIPINMEKYYSNNYYSMKIKKDNWVKSYFKYKRASYALGNKTIFGKYLCKKFNIPPYTEWFQRTGISYENSILDIGSGTGYLLKNLYDIGFNNLSGLDPYNEQDIKYKSTVKIIKGDLDIIEKTFDFIMLNHSFEHMINPLENLKKINSFLNPNGYVLIRIPVANSLAWRNYNVNWYQLDAPRHLFIHTEKSMQIIAKEANFKILDIVYDSDASQFWASEQYLRDIPLMDDISYRVNPKKSIFSKSEIYEYKKKAKELNKLKMGDQACFYLVKSKI